MKDITDAVLDQLLVNSCLDCAIIGNIIDEQYFACYSESPDFVIYRARIEGTSKTASNVLVSLIENWVKSGNVRIIVTQVLMTVDPECAVILPSLTVYEECPQISPSSSSITPTVTSTQEQSQSSFDATLIIIGGSVVIILIIAITIVVLSIVCLLIVKHRNKDISRSVE